MQKEAKAAKAQRKPKAPPDKTPAVGRTGELVLLARHLFLIARSGFRAVSSVLGVVGSHLGLRTAPGPQTLIHWVTRRSSTRSECAPHVAEAQVRGAPLAHGFLWTIDTRLTRSAGTIRAVLALDARQHPCHTDAPSLHHVHCIAVSVALSGTGETSADFLQRVIAVLGRPVGLLKDGGGDLAKAVRL